MVTRDVFDHFDQYSRMELDFKHKQYKSKNLCSFIEAQLNRNYEVYKKKKNKDISFPEYRKLMLKELALHLNTISKSSKF